MLQCLERGLLLWVPPEGVFTKHLCQGCIYWHSWALWPRWPCTVLPSKLEDQHTYQLLDMDPSFRVNMSQWGHGPGWLGMGLGASWAKNREM